MEDVKKQSTFDAAAYLLGDRWGCAPPYARILRCNALGRDFYFSSIAFSNISRLFLASAFVGSSSNTLLKSAKAVS